MRLVGSGATAGFERGRIMTNRRDFLKDACAAAVAAGLPARIWGAAEMMGEPDLVIGLLSDIHIQLPPTVERPGAL